jgi:hypothetical protein
MNENKYSPIWIIYGILGCIFVIISTYGNYNELYFMLISFIYGLIGVFLLFFIKNNKNIKSFNNIYKTDIEHLSETKDMSKQVNMLNKINTNFNNQLNSTKSLDISNIQNIDKFNSSINNKVFNSDPQISKYDNSIITESFSNISYDIFD